MRTLAIFALACGAALAQEPDGPREARNRFDLVATRAAAYQRSADSIEWRLNQEGATLHPEIVALRARIGAALNQARAALDHGDLKNADRAMTTAEALVDRLARRLGG